MRVEEERAKSRKDTNPIRHSFSYFEDSKRYRAREEPPKPSESFPFPRERGRGKREDYTSGQIRPTTLKKFSGKFDGTGDPYEHVSQFHQLLFAEGVTDTHYKVQGFRLTLSGTAQCIDRLKQYIARCLENELPSEEKQILCLLEGLWNSELYMHLFVQNHTDFETCCFEAQRLDDNCTRLHTSGDDTSTNTHSTRH